MASSVANVTRYPVFCGLPERLVRKRAKRANVCFLMQERLLLITGATGYIGSQVVAALLDRFSDEYRCRVVARKTSDCTFLADLPVEIVRADIDEPLALFEAFCGVDTVFHCAGLISYSRHFRNLLYDVNVIGTRNVVNACLAGRVRRLVMTSSIAALGVAEEGGRVVESTSFNEVPHRNGYMEAKHLAELEALRGLAEGLDVVMVNPGVVIGTDSANSASLSSSNDVLRMIYRGQLPFCPSGSTGFVDVRDTADALLLAWQKGERGARYIAVGHNLSFRELFDALGRIPGNSMKRVYALSGVLGYAAGLAGEAFSYFLNRPSVISIDSIRLSAMQLSFNNSRSVHELGMHYRSLDETLRSAVL